MVTLPHGRQHYHCALAIFELLMVKRDILYIPKFVVRCYA